MPGRGGGPASTFRAGAAGGTDPPHRGANLHRPSAPERQPASTLHTGGDWPHRPFAPGWLTAPDEAAGGTGVETGGTGATTPPCPPSNATPGRGPLHPRRSTPLTMRAETTVERRVPAPPAAAATPERRDHCVRTVASALHRCVGGLGRTALPLTPFPCVRIGWSAQSLAPASACGHGSRTPSHR